MTTSPAFRDNLVGPKAFYLNDYEKTTQKECASPIALPVSYSCTIENKILRVAKQILSIIIFPIGIYKLLHRLAGKIVVIGSTPSLMGLPKNYVNDKRQELPLDGEWKYKRLTIAVDNHKIDAMIVGKPETLGNGKWMLYSNGNGEFYEEAVTHHHSLLERLQANGIYFNYTGVGASSGLPDRKAMEKAYCAILAFLEDKQKGIGASEVTLIGHSLGGGVQADAANNHELKPDVKYLFIKSRTFNNLSATASALMGRIFGVLIKVLGWNFDVTASSRKLHAPEIILQTANVRDYEELHQYSKIIHDDVFPPQITLAHALLKGRDCPGGKLFLGMPEGHNGGINDPAGLVDRIQAFASA